MTGSLQIRNNRYHTVVNTKDEYEASSPRWKTTGLLVETGNKKKDKQNKATAERLLLEEIESHKNKVSTNMLFADFLYIWIDWKTNSISRRSKTPTLEEYESYIRLHLDPYFRKKGLKVGEMDEHAVEAFFAAKLSEGYASKTVLNFRVPLRGTLSLAVRKKFLHNNPVDNAESPSLSTPKQKYYNLTELNQLLEKIEGKEDLYNLIKVTAFYGLRRSEVLGLKWEAFDFDNNLFTIQHTVVAGKQKFYYTDTTKTKNSHRALPLIPEIKDMLLCMKEEESENRKLYRNKYAENDYIFKYPDGTLIRPDYITYKWPKILKEHNIKKKITFHQLRHSCVSILLSLGYPLVGISEWVGHSSIKVTKDVYGHMDFKSKLDMAQGLSEKIGRSGSLDPEPPPTSPEPTPAHLIRSDGKVGNNTRGANNIINLSSRFA